MKQKTVLLEAETAKQDFPIFKSHPSLVYLDNASTTQKPASVIDATSEHYRERNANIHRGVYKLSEHATAAYEHTRMATAQFINAAYEEIVFTKGTTESLNLLAYSLVPTLKKGDNIVLTEMEHHSNLVPWQQLAKDKEVLVRFIPVTPEGTINLEKAEEMITKKTKIVSANHVSNVLGTINPVETLGKLAHEQGALFVVDGAQSAGHQQLNMKKINCDYYTFSSHKMYGPTGVGILYGKKELLESMRPFQYGGEMIKNVEWQDAEWNDIPWKFEAGTQNIAGVAGFKAALDYLAAIGMDNIHHHEKELTIYALRALSNLNGVKIYGQADNRAGVISFSIENIHSHDVSAILDQSNIAVRGGHHCAIPLMRKLHTSGTTRASIGLYNTKKDIDQLCEAITKAQKVFAR